MKIRIFYTSKSPANFRDIIYTPPGIDVTIDSQKCLRLDYCSNERVAVDGGIEIFCEGCDCKADCDNENALIKELEALNE